VSTSRPVSVWCVSDGRAGIERQCTALASALSELIAVQTRILRLTPAGPQVWLPPAMWLAPLWALPPQQRRILSPASVDMWPDVWIANGRRSIAYSLRAKAWSEGKSLIVQVQDPRIDVARFDLVVPPRHDRVIGANVIETLGAPVWFTADQIERATAQFPALVSMDQPKVLVVLGGPSKRHRLSEARARAIIADLTKIAAGGAHLLITTSRRTPTRIEAMFRAFANGLNEKAHFFADEARDGANPYLAWLATATAALVSEDSTNMITDAAFFGLPVHLVRLEGGDARFDRLHQGFVKAGVARWFTGELEHWTYAPVRDAMAVARAIAQRLSSAAA
jgi:mitochondrial fission protein ELM1